MTDRRIELIASLEATLPEARTGLPEEILHFVSRLTPLVNVDLLIQDDRRRTLLTWRDDAFFGSGWHVPGGIVRYKERAADRIRSCARDELGADVEAEQTPLAVHEGISEARTRAHHVSLLYRCRLLGQPDEALRATNESPRAGQWRWHERSPSNLLREQAAYARFIG
jgi:ADP-ribose pyrophosphatase YjhB (NUDIX family)